MSGPSHRVFRACGWTSGSLVVAAPLLVAGTACSSTGHAPASNLGSPDSAPGDAGQEDSSHHDGSPFADASSEADARSGDGATPCSGTWVGNRCLVVLTSGQISPYSVAVDSTSAYWTTWPGDAKLGTVNKTSLDGGVVATLASAELSPHAIAVDSTSIYWTKILPLAAGGGGVRTMPIGGGTATDVVVGQDYAHGLALDGTSVYWTAAYAGTVMKVPLAGGAPTTLAAGFTTRNGPFELAVDSTSVYWTNWVPTVGSVMKVPLGGGTPTTLASLQDDAYGIAVDVTSVYWTNSVVDGSVNRVPLGGGIITVLVQHQDQPYGLVVHGTNLYWTNVGDGTVMRASLDGSNLTMLAAHQQAPYHLAVDDTSVYWANYTGGTVMKLTPR